MEKEIEKEVAKLDFGEWEKEVPDEFRNIWRVGGIQGFWDNSGLQEQIRKAFLSSNTIRIKVIRGADLMKEDNSFGLKKIFDTLKSKGANGKHVHVQILLALPCFDSRQVDERYDLRDHMMDKTQFISSWYSFIGEILKYSNGAEKDNKSYMSVDIRFYSEEHATWRFYICKDAGDANTVVLLSNYSRNHSGSETPMYKIIKNDDNIGGFMDSYFEEIWRNAIKRNELADMILSDGNVDNLPEEPKKQHIYSHCYECCSNAVMDHDKKAIQCKELVIRHLSVLEQN